MMAWITNRPWQSSNAASWSRHFVRPGETRKRRRECFVSSVLLSRPKCGAWIVLIAISGTACPCTIISLSSERAAKPSRCSGCGRPRFGAVRPLCPQAVAPSNGPPAYPRVERNRRLLGQDPESPSPGPGSVVAPRPGKSLDGLPEVVLGDLPLVVAVEYMNYPDPFQGNRR